MLNRLWIPVIGIFLVGAISYLTTQYIDPIFAQKEGVKDQIDNLQNQIDMLQEQLETIGDSFPLFKIVQLHDDQDGNAKGWDPNGCCERPTEGYYLIADPDVTSESIVHVSLVSLDDLEYTDEESNHGCHVRKIVDGQGFEIYCDWGVGSEHTPIPDGSSLNYIIINPQQ